MKTRLPKSFVFAFLAVACLLAKVSCEAGTLTGNYFINGTLRTGNNSANPGTNAIAIGINSTASGSNSIALAPFATAAGNYSAALGYNSDAAGIYSLAVGHTAASNGNYSAALGYSSQANQDYSTTIGYVAKTNTPGQGSLAVGDSALATGNYTSAVGYHASSSGNYSLAVGYYAKASADNSVAFGSNVTTASFASLVVGQYNTADSGQSSTAWVSSDDLFVVGNGANSTAPSDAFLVEKNGNTGIGTGNASLSNTVTVNGTIQFNTTYGNTTLSLDSTGNLTVNRRQGDIKMGPYGNGTD